MSLIDKLSARLPFGKKEEALEYFFALDIDSETLTVALWVIEGKHLKILETASDSHSSKDDILRVTDQLLDAVLGDKQLEPEKILFGVPDSWLSDDNLKEDYLKLLRQTVKELELTPMAYVATSHALIHFLEKQEGVPTTAILVGFEQHNLEVIVVRAGKLDGVKRLPRGDNSGVDIEKALLGFTDVETLPSKILIYGQDEEELENLKSHLLSFSWMSKLSFLHFPKIEVLSDEIAIKSVCFAGASELVSDITFVDQKEKTQHSKPILVTTPDKEEKIEKYEVRSDKSDDDDFGFVVGDVSQQEPKKSEDSKELKVTEEIPQKENTSIEAEDFQESAVVPISSDEIAPSTEKKPVLPIIGSFSGLKRLVTKRSLTKLTILTVIILSLVLLIGSYLFLPKAEVKIFVEPKILEKDTQVTADPNLKSVNEDEKKIPGQIVETEVSGSSKAEATGKKQIGDPAKGTIVIYNKTGESKQLSKGTILTSSSGLKFILDTSVSIASQSATDSGITFGKVNTTITSSGIGPDSNLPSGSELTVASFTSSQVAAKAEGNFSGGTSKEVTVVSDEDQKKLLAALASDLRRQAQQKLQEKLEGKKILEEALVEEIVKKSYGKNINDQASEFSLNMTIRYKGTAFEDKDLKMIVGKLVTTQVPSGFQLDLGDTETQADVSKLEKDGKVVFLARFKAKLVPILDTDKIKKQIKGKTPTQVEGVLKEFDNVLGSEVKMTPSLPLFLQRLPLLENNIKIEVGLK